MIEHDQHLGLLMMQCATATPFGRQSGVEQLTVFRWLIDNGHIERTGKPLESPRPRERFGLPTAPKPSTPVREKADPEIRSWWIQTAAPRHDYPT